MQQSVEQVAITKKAPPAPGDIMKTAATIHHSVLSYNQAYRVLKETEKKKAIQDRDSFKLIIPYLKLFQKLNVGSVVSYERVQGTNCISQCFLYPGIMENAMHFVQPVMSLDACHLKSQ
jgi:hypothetical protein